MRPAEEHIVVLSDVHANGRALSAALAATRRGPVDRLVILGDLLTYGCDGDRVLDLVAEAQAEDHAVLILGNHDQLYLDLRSGVRAYYASLPDWLRESVDQTMKSVDVSRLERDLHWSKEFVDADVLFAHANPYEYGDWSYLNSEADHATAADRLAARGHRFGVFGHTHRSKIFVRTADGANTWATVPHVAEHLAAHATTVVVNPGSIGQPRDRSRRSTLLRIDRTATATTFSIEAVDYDVDGHLREVRASGMSQQTIDRLCAFFVGDASAD